MSESSLGPVHWLHGLRDYFEFAKDKNSKNYVDFILKLVYADNPIINITEIGSMEEFVYTLRKFADSPILDMLYKYYREKQDPVPIQDAFSRGQIQSKIWLATELAKIQKDFKNIVILAGWFGQLFHFINLSGITFDKGRVFEIDPVSCKISDSIFNLDNIENYKVKSAEFDINDSNNFHRTGIEYTVKNYQTDAIFKEKLIPDLIINTSAEHFRSDWYKKLSVINEDLKSLFVIQSNNLFGIPGHLNCVHSLDHMKKKFPMIDILYEGEIQLIGYKRFMLIGRP